MQDLERRQGAETGSGHVIIPADAANIRIGVVRIQDRVFIGTVSVVGHPHLRYTGEFFPFSGSVFRFDLQRMFQFIFPLPDVSEPRFRGFVAESFFQGGEDGVVAEVRFARGGERIEVIGFVLHLFPDVSGRDPGSQSDRLFGVFHGVVYRPVGTPAGDQSPVVGVGNRAFDVLYARTEQLFPQRFVEEGFHHQVPVSGVEDVAVEHVQFRSPVLPAGYPGFHDGSDRAVRRDPFRTGGDRFDVRGLLAVPSFQGADATTPAYTEHIVPEPAGQLFVVGVKL